MELKKKMDSETNYGFAKKKNDGYWEIIYVIFTNYGIEKNNGSETNYGFAKEKNDGYSIKIYKIIMNYGIEKKILGYRRIMDLQKKMMDINDDT